MTITQDLNWNLPLADIGTILSSQTIYLSKFLFIPLQKVLEDPITSSEVDRALAIMDTDGNGKLDKKGTQCL